MGDQQRMSDPWAIPPMPDLEPVAPTPRPAPVEWAAPKPRKRKRRPRKPGTPSKYASGITARYAGWCGKCDVRIYPGDPIIQRASTADPWHLECAGKGE